MPEELPPDALPAEEAEAEARADAASLLSPGKVATQLTGFVVGVVLLAWIVRAALREGEWSRIADAPVHLLAALLGCTLLSTLLNGACFWISIQPVKDIGFWDLQRLNLVANMLNYAPIRLGAVARVLYHLRVDGLGFLQISSWFTFVGYTFVLGVASCAVATVVHPHADAIWGLLVAGQLVLGGLAARLIGTLPLVARFGRGLDRIVSRRWSLWGALALRVADIAAFTGRMAVAAAILQIDLGAGAVLLLAIVALVAGMVPFGRLGFREFCVAEAATHLSMMVQEVQGNMNQLALIESGGEAIVFVPAGALLLVWFRHRWREGKTR